MIRLLVYLSTALLVHRSANPPLFDLSVGLAANIGWRIYLTLVRRRYGLKYDAKAQAEA